VAGSYECGDAPSASIKYSAPVSFSGRTLLHAVGYFSYSEMNIPDSFKVN
jgi:hypothetical protein